MGQNIILSVLSSLVQSVVYIVIKLIKMFWIDKMLISTDCFTNTQQILCCCIFVFQFEINAVQALQIHPRRWSCLVKLQIQGYLSDWHNYSANYWDAVVLYVYSCLHIYSTLYSISVSAACNVSCNSLFQTSDITVHRHTAVLKGLPLYLRDSQEKLFRNCLVSGYK